MYKRLLKNSAIYGILPQLSKIASFFVLPLTTPFLTQTDYGIVGVLSAYVGAFSVFQLLGVNVVVFNSYYHHRGHYKWYWRQLYGFLTLWSVVYFFLLGVLLYYIIPEEAMANRWMIIALKIIPPLLFGPAELFASSYYMIHQRAMPVASRALLGGLLGVGLNYYLIAILKMGYMGWIVSEAITSTITGILFLIPVLALWKVTPIFNFKKRLIRRALKVSLPVIPHYYASYLLNSSDRVVMERVNIPTNEIGRYSLAYSFGVYIETITNSINQAVGPNLLELIRSEKWKEYQQLVFAFQALMLSACFTISLWVPQWIPLVIRNTQLQNIYTLLVIIIMSYSYRPMYIGCNQILFFYEKTKVLWRITLAAGIINLIANIILIPIYGITAAALTTFFSLMYMGFSGFWFDHYKKISELSLKPVLWLSTILLLLIISLFALYWSMYIKVFINLGVILILFCVTVYNKATWTRFRNLRLYPQKKE